MPPRAAASFHTDDVITDPTAIPETEDDAKEYEKELQAVGGDWPKVEPLARSLSQSDVAHREARAMAYSALGNALENTGRSDEAIDAYRGAVDMGDASAQVARRRTAGGRAPWADGGRAHPAERGGGR